MEMGRFWDLFSGPMDTVPSLYLRYAAKRVSHDLYFLDYYIGSCWINRAC
jgi:hypothetical protein